MCQASTYSNSGLFQFAEFGNLVGILAKANERCLRLGLNFGWGVQ
jgi:hypothetical protein